MGWRNLTLVLVLGLAVACDSTGETAVGTPQAQRFLVGPDPAHTGNIDHRFSLEVPQDYVPHELRDAAGISGVGRFTFFADARTFAPASGRLRADPHNLMISFFWAPPDFVSKRVDGSWLNAYSVYAVPLSGQYGLEVRRPANSQMAHKRLLFTTGAEQDALIECAYLPDIRPNLCRMWSRQTGPLVEVWFERTLLPHWRHLSSRSHALAAAWTNAADQRE